MGEVKSNVKILHSKVMKTYKCLTFIIAIMQLYLVNKIMLVVQRSCIDSMSLTRNITIEGINYDLPKHAKMCVLNRDEKERTQ